MKRNKFSLLVSISLVLMFVFSAFGQNDFNDSNAAYTFSLPSDNWKMTVKPSQMSPNVEYVYKYRKDGHLEVRKMAIKKDSLFSEIFREEEQKLQFVPGYVAGKEENFRGNYGGKIFNYEYVRSGRQMSGRFYFLKTDPTTVYVLRFRGLKDSLRSIRNETDSIARTFKLKEAK